MLKHLQLLFMLIILKNMFKFSNPATSCYGDTFATVTITCSGPQLCFKSIALPSYTVQRGCAYDNLTSAVNEVTASTICLNTACFNNSAADTLVRIYLCNTNICNRAMPSIDMTSHMRSPAFVLSLLIFSLLFFYVDKV